MDMSEKYKRDSAGQLYARVENVRITVAHRSGAKDWGKRRELSENIGLSRCHFGKTVPRP